MNLRGELSHFTPAEDETLRAAYAEGRGPRGLVGVLNRSAKAISRRGRLLGLHARDARPPHDWNDGETKRLLELAAAELSSNAIARRIGVSRNAVLGKLHRMGVDFGRSNKFSRAPKPPPLPQPDNLKPMIDLRPHECMFPFGDPKEDVFGFCSAPVKPGSSYCHRHAEICYQELTKVTA